MPSFERFPTPEQESSRWIDSQLFERLQSAGDLQVLSSLEQNKDYFAEERSKFERGEVENPTFNYDHIDLENLEKKERELVGFRNYLDHAEDIDPSLARLYKLRVNERLASTWMLQAAARGDDRAFSHYSTYMYGKPDETAWEYTVHDVVDLLERGRSSDRSETQEVAVALADRLQFEELPRKTYERPSEELATRVKEQTLDDIGHLLPRTVEGELYGSDQIARAFADALAQLGDPTWRVVIDSKKTSVTVNTDTALISVPENRKPCTGAQLRGLVAHEVGTHVLRSIRGSQSPLQLLSLGLDRYTENEEGVAKMREAVAAGSNFEGLSGLDSHLAVCLARGLDGTPRTFRETYEELVEFFRLQHLLKNPDNPEVDQKARDQAWTRCVRTFRGTSGTSPGLCFTKDIAYREGSLSLWKALENNPGLLKILSVGKFDCSRPEHVELLARLGIINEEM